ncbi:hypothetical protein L2E82_21452 [Cichorium intybus]|uniref:Uncharacterized protein n=1 Tax=Cichorium intybus TaxID=13427 RepID=A0ACB9DWT0_CICIN|nr:hypothetical protein L2E82_21452 [Cichorium intybus]
MVDLLGPSMLDSIFIMVWNVLMIRCNKCGRSHPIREKVMSLSNGVDKLGPLKWRRLVRGGKLVALASVVVVILSYLKVYEINYVVTLVSLSPEGVVDVHLNSIATDTLTFESGVV